MCNRLSQSFYNLQNGVVHCSVARKVRQECQRIVDQPEIMIKVVKVQVVREAAENKLMNDIAQRLVDLLRVRQSSPVPDATNVDEELP